MISMHSNCNNSTVNRLHLQKWLIWFNEVPKVLIWVNQIGLFPLSGMKPHLLGIASATAASSSVIFRNHALGKDQP
jgi:hypothetical protein